MMTPQRQSAWARFRSNLGMSIEVIAERFLMRRGRVVLARDFRGFALGGKAVAIEGPERGVWTLALPAGDRLFQMNGATITPMARPKQ